MSGGHWEYEQYRTEAMLTQVGTDCEVARRFPKVAHALEELSKVLGAVLHDLDWDLSGDTCIKDEELWQAEALASLAEVLVKAGRTRQWFSANDHTQRSGPFATQEEAWESQRAKGSTLRAHVQGAYVWPEYIDD